MDYILRISGDFEKGECGKCPLLGRYGEQHMVICHEFDVHCPLEEATVAKNATVEGEWMVINAEGDSIEVITAQCNDMRGGKE